MEPFHFDAASSSQDFGCGSGLSLVSYNLISKIVESNSLSPEMWFCKLILNNFHERKEKVNVSSTELL